MYKVKEIDNKFYEELLEDYSMLGLYYMRSNDKFIGIDNSNGECFVEEFKNLEDCIYWLKNKEADVLDKEENIMLTNLDMEESFFITKWCKSITDDGKDLYKNKGRSRKAYPYKFRLLDDDDIVYGYGVAKDMSFLPLRCYKEVYGVTGIQYKDDETGEYKFL